MDSQTPGRVKLLKLQDFVHVDQKKHNKNGSQHYSSISCGITTIKSSASLKIYIPKQSGNTRTNW